MFIVMFARLFKKATRFYKTQGVKGKITFDKIQNIITFISNKNEVLVISLNDFMLPANSEDKDTVYNPYTQILSLINYSIQVYYNSIPKVTGVCITIIGDQGWQAYKSLKTRYYIEYHKIEKDDNNSSDD